MNFFVCFLLHERRDNSTSLLGLEEQLFVCLGHVKAREGITLLGGTSGFKLLPKARKIMILFTCHSGFMCNSIFKKGELPGAPLTNFKDEAREGGGGGSKRGLYFIPKEITTSEFVCKQKSLLF